MDHRSPNERFQVIYDRNHDDLWRYCLRRTTNPQEAEDVLAETLAIAWRRLDDIPPEAGARPWLFGVARNLLRANARSNTRRLSLMGRIAGMRRTSQMPDPAELAMDDRDSVLVALDSLKEADREIIRLAAWEQLRQAEIAEVLGCSENAVTIRLHRARRRLETELEKEPTRVKGRPASSHVEDERRTERKELADDR